MDNVGKETVLGGKLVESVVRKASGAEETVEDVLSVLASEVAVLVELGDDDLDSSVVTSLNESVGGRALAGDVEVDVDTFGVLHLETCF